MPIYLISDLHLNHANIIKYCHRPFSSVQEMNATLINNWNRVVGEKDIVFCLGDLAFGRKPLSWLNILNGNVVMIKGSHEPFGLSRFILHHNGNLFLFIHNPDFAPSNWLGWVIHGHKHNNDLANYPFINRERKRVNVSAELINYTPISLDAAEKMIKAQEEVIKTVP